MRDRREKFVELAEKRVGKAIDMLRLIGNLSNSSNYEFDEEDVSKILGALDSEMRRLRSRFQSGLSKGQPAKFKL